VLVVERVSEQRLLGTPMLDSNMNSHGIIQGCGKPEVKVISEVDG
jgi:hypothetical protein